MSGENTPLVSVVCLCYNHEKTVAQAIGSVLAQKTDFPFELIVHDDASVDSTPRIIRAYAEKHPDIIVPVLQTENRMQTCNIAETYIAPLLRGKYVAVCEGDDYWTDPEKLALQVRAMEADPGITMCFHAVTQVLPGGETQICRPCKETGAAPAELVVKRGGMFCPSVSLLVRRDIADRWPEYRRQADVYDYPLQVLSASAGKVWYIDRVMAAYRFQYENSWTALRADVTDTAHLENETRWLMLFNEDTDGRFAYEIDYHLAHMWFTEYRKHPEKELREKARPYIKKLRGKDKLLFSGLVLAFSVLGPRANRIYLHIKKRLLK
ncbi:MAG: glycosyltransferase [Clostridia bacterium]|nr:glycosyltransferase [Clostridia bacterium]MBQ9506877.1 glycosyltransferase [Clostridia bacterium]